MILFQSHRYKLKPSAPLSLIGYNFQRIKSILASTASSCDCGASLNGLKITSDNKGCSREQQVCAIPCHHFIDADWDISSKDSAVLLRKDASTTIQSLAPNAEDSYTAEADSNSIPFKIEVRLSGPTLCTCI